ncbi:hypothetical protein DFH11DRAFT_1566839 [Phellopilus nigrolimitatus]|nr:hypothetical protein DFH11DRAFT_1566839 [Phellopilus nigrolimitatus]
MSALDSSSDDFVSSFLLKPGSSLNPTFLLVLDGAFAALLCIFISLLFLLSGSLHIVALIGIELCLWASVKWFVNELKSPQSQTGGQAHTEANPENEAKKIQ